jgi:hypothetical protein
MVQTELYNTDSRLWNSAEFVQHLPIFEIPGLLGSWAIACACKPDDSANIVYQYGALLVQSGALVDLENSYNQPL